MRLRFVVLLSLGLGVLGPAARAQPPAPSSGPSSAGGQDSCLAWTTTVEHYNGIPAGLLTAISYVESGHNGAPWPWTLNVGGTPEYLPNFAAAARLLHAPDGRLRLDVAVGCMQIYLGLHAQIFQDPVDLLVPRLNVAYAGWYLAQLHAEYGSWTAAVAHYGARHVDAQVAYVCRVLGYRIALGYQGMTPAAEQLCHGKF